jgi:hypothetical protein
LLYTFETRFDVTPELSELLLDNASHWSWGVRKAWNFRFRKGLSEQSTYAQLVGLGFTRTQVGSILKFVDICQLPGRRARRLWQMFNGKMSLGL